jgi:multidrug resistance efflux pump
MHVPLERMQKQNVRRKASAFEADTAKAQERIATLEKEAAAAKAAIADADARAAEAQSALERAKSDTRVRPAP